MYRRVGWFFCPMIASQDFIFVRWSPHRILFLSDDRLTGFYFCSMIASQDFIFVRWSPHRIPFLWITYLKICSVILVGKTNIFQKKSTHFWKKSWDVYGSLIFESGIYMNLILMVWVLPFILFFAPLFDVFVSNINLLYS